MDNSQVSIKIRYQGALEHFKFDEGTFYEDVITMVMYRFEIPTHLRNALILTNIEGYIFDKQLFEYFILLFPQPQLVFYVRHRWTQLRQGQSEMTLFQKIRYLKSQKNGRRSSSININQHIQETEKPSIDQQHQHEEHTYNAAPVRRQNCFLGTIPKHGTRLDGEEKVEISKRLRMLSAMDKQRRAKRDQDKRNATAFKNAIRF